MKNLTQGLLLLLALVGCGGSTETPPPPPVTPPGTPPAVPGTPPPPAAPGTLTLGAPAVPVVVAASPGVTFTVATSAEYQIDVSGPEPLDAQLMLFLNGSYVTSDSDSGEGVNARLVQFLAPGTYEIRPTEWRHRAMNASVTLLALPPLAPVGATTPGGPPVVVNAPAGDTDRASAGEVTLTIATAGNYRIDALGPTCDSQMVLIQNGAEVTRDSDSGENNNAQVTTMLSPGTYSVRVYDWVHRACAITVSAAPAP